MLCAFFPHFRMTGKLRLSCAQLRSGSVPVLKAGNIFFLASEKRFFFVISLHWECGGSGRGLFPGTSGHPVPTHPARSHVMYTLYTLISLKVIEGPF